MLPLACNRYRGFVQISAWDEKTSRERKIFTAEVTRSGEDMQEAVVKFSGSAFEEVRMRADRCTFLGCIGRCGSYTLILLQIVAQQPGIAALLVKDIGPSLYLSSDGKACIRCLHSILSC